MRLLYIFTFLLLISAGSFAQSDTIKIPIDRQLFHEKIIDEQSELELVDKKKDKMFTVGEDESINLLLTDILYRKIDALRFSIETNTALPTRNEKVKYLRYIEYLLRDFRVALRSRKINALEFPTLVSNFELLMKASIAKERLLPIVAGEPYELARIHADIFADDAQIKDLENVVYLKYIALNPNNILPSIRPYLGETFADSLLVVAAYRTPTQLYSYAQSKYSPEGKKIRLSDNHAVKMITKLSDMPTALNYFPFLDDLLSEKITIEQIEKTVGDGEKGYDSIGYFKLLVQTEIGYAKRLQQKDTAIAMFGTNGLKATLKSKALKHFISPINLLHNSSVPVRMRAIQPLTATELYYVIIMGENDIYTSSYKHSFARLKEIMTPTFQGDVLLQDVNRDYFKKFVKMAANYNHLDDFLASMSPENAGTTMKDFVGNLDEGTDLEDAVDVADAYSSIVNPTLRSTILNYVKENELAAQNNNNNRGTVIYNLLKLIFESADDEKSVDLTAAIGIPSIYDIATKNLKDDKGRIVQQVFFYGDEDGKAFFPSFVNSFPASDWSLTMKPEWVEIKSKKGEVYVYANRPLDSDKNLDDSSQVHLGNFLRSQQMHPSVVVHRGHSYWLKGTIDRMPDNAKIVVLGSCGGYQNLAEILTLAPEAHIISTKETGTGDINRQILNQINQTLINEEKLEWRGMWASLTKLFSTETNKAMKETWDDYVPPYKNLGAIFIKACNKKIEAGEGDLGL